MFINKLYVFNLGYLEDFLGIEVFNEERQMLGGYGFLDSS